MVDNSISYYAVIDGHQYIATYYFQFNRTHFRVTLLTSGNTYQQTYFNLVCYYDLSDSYYSRRMYQSKPSAFQSFDFILEEPIPDEIDLNDVQLQVESQSCQYTWPWLRFSCVTPRQKPDVIIS